MQLPRYGVGDMLSRASVVVLHNRMPLQHFLRKSMSMQCLSGIDKVFAGALWPKPCLCVSGALSHNKQRAGRRAVAALSANGCGRHLWQPVLSDDRIGDG